MTAYETLQQQLKAEPKTWLITGVAGFIGSNLLEALLKLDQQVVGLDNFSTGHRHNLDEVKQLLTSAQWAKFRFIEGDICDLAACHRACDGVDYVLHQAALGSVPRSIEDPITANRNNIDGFLNMLVAARDAEVRRFVYAASSSPVIVTGEEHRFLASEQLREAGIELGVSSTWLLISDTVWACLRFIRPTTPPPLKWP